MNEFATWFDSTPVSVALKNALWVVPTVQSVHILAVCLVLSAAFFVGIRSWNVAGLDWSLSRWGNRLYPAQWWALLVLLLSGSILVTAEPVRELTNYVFKLKMLGVIIASMICFWLQRRIASRDEKQAGFPEKFVSIVLLCLWLAIIFAGRWIAYI